jgi:hypothetical protein
MPSPDARKANAVAEALSKTLTQYEGARLFSRLSPGRFR